MTQATVVNKTARINKIRSTFNKKNPQLPGNLLINDKWFSSREFRNNLLGAGLPPELALPSFLGCTINWNEVTISQELLDANGGKYTHKVNGRDVVYTKPGVLNIEMVIDFTTLQISDSTLNLNRLVHLFSTGRPAPRAQQAPAEVPPAQQVETIEEPTQEVAKPNKVEDTIPAGQLNPEVEEEIVEPVQ